MFVFFEFPIFIIIFIIAGLLGINIIPLLFWVSVIFCIFTLLISVPLLFDACDTGERAVFICAIVFSIAIAVLFGILYANDVSFALIDIF